ncbi:MAG: adenosine kinase [SAR324 cluster bacterium]|nr:adenosine kinase [SAR324 cluster bacterium]
MTSLDVYGICNPLIDLLSHVPEPFLGERELEKDRMYLVDLEQQQGILMALAAQNLPIEFAPGGSGANTMIGITQLGGHAAFTGKVGLDEHGDSYRDGLEEQGVKSCLGTGPGTTGSSLILVAPDAARTMNTHLGMCQQLEAADIDLEALSSSRYLYVTGYLWDTDTQKTAVRHALTKAQEFGVRVSLSLSDPFCVNRHHEDFVRLLRESVDLVFCNQEEAFLLMETSVSQEAVNRLGEWVETVVMTMGVNGALIRHQGETVYVDALPVSVEDTTGAGDAFAAGYLYGVTHDKTPLESGRIASALAGAVIAHTGPRYQGNAQAKVRESVGNLV